MMKVLSTLALFLCMALSVNCPNDCSGHGVCGKNRKCYCNKQLGLGLNNANYEEEYYTGTDCSKRMCPKGPSHPYINTNAFWWEEDTNVYQFERYTTEQAKHLASAEYYFNGGKSILKAISDITALKIYKLGGHLSCYLDEDTTNFYSTYMVNAIDEYTTSNSQEEGFKAGIPLLYGIQMYPITATKKEKENDKTKNIYCRVIYIREDYSMFGLWPINDYDSEGEYRSSVKLEVPSYYYPDEDNYLGTMSLVMNNYIIYEVAERKRVIFECIDYDGKMKDFETDFIIVNGFINITTVHSLGQCFMLYSQVNGPLKLQESELYNYMGEEGEFGKLLKSSVMLWGDSKTFDNKDKIQFNTSLQLKSFDTENVFTSRDTSVGEIKDIISIGGSAMLYEFTMNDEDSFYPIRMQMLHVSKYDFDIDHNEIINIEFYEPITIVNEVLIKEEEEATTIPDPDATTTTTTTTDPDTTTKIEKKIDLTNRIIYALQLFQEGPHGAVECSGVGECNRETGKCECPIGYQGSACQRTSCPNNCSGKGKCLPYSSSESIYGDEVLYRCVCDGGFRGSDCSKFECPSGEDPKKATNVKSDTTGEFRDCSGRGICDYDTGLCSCFDGFSGEACDKISSMY